MKFVSMSLKILKQIVVSLKIDEKLGCADDMHSWTKAGSDISDTAKTIHMIGVALTNIWEEGQSEGQILLRNQVKIGDVKSRM